MITTATTTTTTQITNIILIFPKTKSNTKRILLINIFWFSKTIVEWKNFKRYEQRIQNQTWHFSSSWHNSLKLRAGTDACWWENLVFLVKFPEKQAKKRWEIMKKKRGQRLITYSFEKHWKKNMFSYSFALNSNTWLYFWYTFFIMILQVWRSLLWIPGFKKKKGIELKFRNHVLMPVISSNLNRMLNDVVDFTQVV